MWRGCCLPLKASAPNREKGRPRWPIKSRTELSSGARRAEEKEAFDVLVLRYQHRLTKLIARYVRDHAEVLDVAQESFLKAYRALPGFRGDSAFYTWIYRIAINTAKNHLAAQARRPAEADVDPADAEQFDGMDSLRENATPEHLLMRDEIQSTVVGAIEQLPEDLRVALVLRELEGPQL